MATILQNHFVLAVHDVKEAARFYVEVMGFHVTGEPAGWIFVRKDQCTIMLGECPDDLHPSALGCHSYFGYLMVDDVDGYYAELKGKGAKGIGEVGDKPWGMREFSVRTADGHGLTVGQEIKGGG